MKDLTKATSGNRRQTPQRACAPIHTTMNRNAQTSGRETPTCRKSIIECVQPPKQISRDRARHYQEMFMRGAQHPKSVLLVDAVRCLPSS
jgi:hypothetical protein